MRGLVNVGRVQKTTGEGGRPQDVCPSPRRTVQLLCSIGVRQRTYGFCGPVLRGIRQTEPLQTFLTCGVQKRGALACKVDTLYAWQARRPTGRLGARPGSTQSGRSSACSHDRRVRGWQGSSCTERGEKTSSQPLTGVEPVIFGYLPPGAHARRTSPMP